MNENNYKKAAKEVNEILKYVSEEKFNKIPIKFQKFLIETEDKTYNANIDERIDLEGQNLLPETKTLLSIIYKNYWCTEQEQKEYDKLLNENEKKYQEELIEKYNTDNIFKNKKEQEETNNLPVEIKSESFYQKLVNFIKQIFQKKK